MTNKKAGLIGLGAFILLAVIIVSVWPQMPSIQYPWNVTPTVTTTVPITIEDDNGLFTLSATYTGNSTWSYTVTAQLPTPCDKATVDALVAESYPEQVTIRVVTSNTSEMCIQVIQDFSFDGTFYASEKANIRLSVND